MNDRRVDLMPGAAVVVVAVKAHGLITVGVAAVASLASPTTRSMAAANKAARRLVRATGLLGSVMVRQCRAPSASPSPTTEGVGG